MPTRLTRFVRPLSRHRLAGLAAAAAVATMAGGCAKLDPFGADLGRVHVGEKVVRAPYLSTVSYFGHLSAEQAGRESVAGKAMQPLYVWLPAATPELGVRVVSPSRPYATPNEKTDFVTQGFKDHRRDKDGFDPTLVVERCAAVVDPTDIDRPCTKWVKLGETTDAVTPPETHEGHDRAELRLTSHPEDGNMALVRGIYRIGVADWTHPNGTGTFLVQLGAPVYLNGAVVAPSLAELSSVVRSQAKGLSQVPGIGHAHDNGATDKEASVAAPTDGLTEKSAIEAPKANQ